MAWRVEFLRSAAREFQALEADVQDRVSQVADRLSVDPHYPGTKKLEGYPNLRRCRVGDYRIVYRAVQGVVTIVRIGTRAEVYRRLDRLG
jgi:mRNA interferase RelE/StbE